MNRRLEPIVVRAPEASSQGGAAGEDARAFFQSRLALFGKVCFVVDLAYFTIFTLGLWSEPGTGFVEALSQAFSWTAAGEYAVFGGTWAFGSARRPWSLRTLRSVDASVMIACGIIFSSWCFLFPFASFGVYEMLLALVVVMSFRAILLPSSGLRTALVSLAACLPGFVATIVATRMRADEPMSSTTTILFAFNWIAAGVAFSTVASSIIYGLRREVRDARQLGHYTLVRRLGSGGMGVVWLATHARLRRLTAVKLIRPDRAGESAIERFEREVQATSQLTHPNTVQVYDFGRTADGVFYYAMEYLDGIDLEALLAFDGPQPPARVVYLLKQACGALDEAHRRGLLHRDVKPANLVLCRGRGEHDTLKVLDFGLVASAAERLEGQALTGTPLYLAPETITSPERVDARSDVYALGAVAWALLTGRPPFAANTLVELCAQHVHGRLAPLPGVPETLSRLILRCLSKDPTDRFQSAQALRTALEDCGVAPWTEQDAQRWWDERSERLARWQTEHAAAASTPGERAA